MSSRRSKICFVGRIPVKKRFGAEKSERASKESKDSSLVEKLGIVDWPLMEREASEMAKKLGLQIDLKKTVGELPIAHRQMIEIAKVLMRHTRVLVMDEPTSSLTNVEIQRLFAIIHQLREEGTSVVT